MTKNLFIHGVGVYRVSKQHKIDEGDDGVLWMPSKRLAAVTDGIGSTKGNGMEDIKRYEEALKTVDDTREGIREAFFSVCGPESESTIVSLWFPKSFEKKGLLLHAGDSHAVRLRKGTRNQVLDLLSDEHSLWNDIKEKASPEIQDIMEHFESVRNGSLGDYFDKKKEMLQLIRHLDQRLRDEYMDPDEFEGDLDEEDFLAQVLYGKILSCRNIFCLCLSNSASEVKEVIGAGKSFSVREDDRFALMSDGIFRDVLTLEEVQGVLEDYKDPIDAARNLVQASIDKGTKYDDKAAVVIDVSARYPKKPLMRSVKKSRGVDKLHQWSKVEL